MGVEIGRTTKEIMTAELDPSIEQEIERLQVRREQLRRLVDLKKEVSILEFAASMPSITGEFEDALKIVCNAWNYSPEQIFSSNRKYALVEARHVLCYLAHEVLYISFSEIGRKIRRDHGAVLHGVNRIKGYLQVYPEFKKKVENLASILTAKEQPK